MVPILLVPPGSSQSWWQQWVRNSKQYYWQAAATKIALTMTLKTTRHALIVKPHTLLETVQIEGNCNPSSSNTSIQNRSEVVRCIDTLHWSLHAAGSAGGVYS